MAFWPTSVATDANLFIAVNSLETTISSAIDSSVTTIPLTDISRFPPQGAIAIDLEVIFYTGISGSSLTGCTRGADGTSAASHLILAPAAAAIVAYHHNALKDEIEAIEQYLSTYLSGVTSSVQTQLDNKLPITATLNDLADVIVPSPNLNDVLAWNGSDWVNEAPPSVSGGAIVSYFLDDSGTTGGNALLNVTPDTAPEQIDSVTVTNATRLIDRYIASAAIGLGQIDGGTWEFDTYRYVSAVASVTELIPVVYRRIVGTGTLTISGSGTSRTATITGGTPFVSGDANSDMTLSGYVETPTATFQISAFTSSSVVTITTPSGYVNESSVSYAEHKWLFSTTTGNITDTTVALQSIIVTEPAFLCNTTDKLVIAYYGKTTSLSAETIYLVHNGATHYSHIHTPLLLQHNDLGGLQGGQSGEYYHLTAAEHAIATQAASPTLSGYVNTTLQEFAGIKSFDSPSRWYGATSGGIWISPIAVGSHFTFIQNSSTTADRTYTLPEVGANASFVMTEGAQTINGAKTFGSAIVGSLTGGASLDLPLTGGTMSGNIAMGGNKLTGLAAGSTAGDSLRYEQLVGVYALDSGVVHIAGTETITGTKTFTAQLNTRYVVPTSDGSYQLGDSTHAWSTIYGNVFSVGRSGGNGTLDIYPSTASDGKIEIVANNNAGNYTTTITNASQAAARTYTVPDVGADASFVMTEGAQTINGAKTFSGRLSQGVTQSTYSLYTKGGNTNNLGIDNGGQQYTELDFLNNGTTRAYIYWDQTNTNEVFYSFGTMNFNATSATFSGQLIGKGTTTNDSAAAGNIGEYVVSSLAKGSAITLSTGVYADITSISLTAGDWDVTGIVSVGMQTSSNYLAAGGISSHSGNSAIGLTDGDTFLVTDRGAPPSSTPCAEAITVGSVRVSISTTTTYYLKAYAQFTISGTTATSWGRISARRIR